MFDTLYYDRSEWNLPDIDDMFGVPDVTPRERGADELQKALDKCGFNAKVGAVSVGPSVSRYEVIYEKNERIGRLPDLTTYIESALGVLSVRIVLPEIYRNSVYIEIPNSEAKIVPIRELLACNVYKGFDGKLPLALGLGFDNTDYVIDLKKVHDLLVAGRTGSGKTVCIQSLIISLLCKRNPDELKFVMIDPKIVGLSVYNGIPHLLMPVITDPKKAVDVLRGILKEIKRRQTLFEEKSVHNIDRYNECVLSGSSDTASECLPEIVVIIDELADIMMASYMEAESTICYILQKGWQSGIHMIIATQRLSTDIITGLIKANMLRRIAFATVSAVDSRTIIDMPGAEKLIGKGDMLLSVDEEPKRLQGVFASDEEVGRIASFWKNQAEDNLELFER